METVEKKTVSALLAETDALIGQAVKYMELNGIRYDLGEWVTIKEYAARFGVSTQVVTNWIRRGIVPAENVISVPELNDIRLIKAVPYHGE